MKVFCKNVLSEPLSTYSRIVCDLFVFSYHRTIFFHERLGVSSIVYEAKRLSAVTQKPVLLHAAFDVEGERYLSVLVCKEGKIAGVADAMTEKGYEKGAAIRLYTLSGIVVGVAVGKDILSAGVDNAFLSGAKGLIHVTREPFQREYYGAYLAHARLTDATYLGLFSDCVVKTQGERLSLQSEGVVIDVPFCEPGRVTYDGFLHVVLE